VTEFHREDMKNISYSDPNIVNVR